MNIQQMTLPGIQLEELTTVSNPEFTVGIEIEMVGFYNDEWTVLKGLPTLVDEKTGVIYFAIGKVERKRSHREADHKIRILSMEIEEVYGIMTEEKFGCKIGSPKFKKLSVETQRAWTMEDVPSIEIIDGQLSDRWRILPYSWIWPRPRNPQDSPALKGSEKILRSIGSDWTASYECDLTDAETNGVELQSPILEGDYRSVYEVCEAFKGFVSPDESCGLHIHIGMKKSDFTLDQVKTMIFRWKQIEDIVSKLPCYQLEEPRNMPIRRFYPADKVIQVTDLDTFKDGDLIYMRRGMFMNLRSLGDHGTIEFRGFRGTLDADLIQRLIEFLISFVSDIVSE